MSTCIVPSGVYQSYPLTIVIKNTYLGRLTKEFVDRKVWHIKFNRTFHMLLVGNPICQNSNFLASYIAICSSYI